MGQAPPPTGRGDRAEKRAGGRRAAGEVGARVIRVLGRTRRGKPDQRSLCKVVLVPPISLSPCHGFGVCDHGHPALLGMVVPVGASWLG